MNNLLNLRGALPYIFIFWSQLTYALPYTLQDGVSGEKFIQGEVATPAQICKLTNHPIFNHAADGNHANAMYFPISNQLVETFLRGIPRNVQHLVFEESTSRQVVNNLKDCLSTMDSQAQSNFFRFGLKQQIDIPQIQIYRQEIEDDNQQSRWRFFVMLIGLQQTHELFVSSMGVFDEKLKNQDLLIETERKNQQDAATKQAEAVRLQNEQAMQDRKNQEDVFMKQAEAIRLRNEQAIKDQDASIAREKQEKAKLYSELRTDNILKFIFSLCISIIAAVGAIFIGILHYKPKIQSERENILSVN